MKVLLLSTSLLGGAGGSTYRLHLGLQNIGVNSQVLVQATHVNDEAVIVVPRAKQVKLLKRLGKLPYIGDLEYLPLRLHPGRDSELFSLQYFPELIAQRVAQLSPDVINLHWICGGLLRIETVPVLKKPIVWTLHDMWPFTGGCHYSKRCDHYTDSCGACPILNSNKNRDVSRWVWRRKAKAWKHLDLTIVTPSSWLARCARSSTLFKDLRIEVIPYGIDTKKYKPIDRQVSRDILNLPQHKLFVLFVAWSNAHRKGFHLLQQALQKLSQSGWRDKMELLVVGFSEPKNLPDLGIKSHFIGKLSDAISMALVYSAADVFVIPSLQDNLPNTVLEATACGTPCVGFSIGGIPDMIEHRQNGYLVRPYQVEDLAQGIAWVLEDHERHQRLSYRAREKATQEFALDLEGRRYAALFGEIVENHNRRVCT